MIAAIKQQYNMRKMRLSPFSMMRRGGVAGVRRGQHQRRFGGFLHTNEGFDFLYRSGPQSDVCVARSGFGRRRDGCAIYFRGDGRRARLERRRKGRCSGSPEIVSVIRASPLDRRISPATTDFPTR